MILKGTAFRASANARTLAVLAAEGLRLDLNRISLGRAALQRRVTSIVLKAEPASAGDTSFALPLIRNPRMS